MGIVLNAYPVMFPVNCRPRDAYVICDTKLTQLGCEVFFDRFVYISVDWYVNMRQFPVYEINLKITQLYFSKVVSAIHVMGETWIERFYRCVS